MLFVIWSLLRLDEVRLHVLLEVEVSDLIRCLAVEESHELLVRNNLATIVRSLKLVVLDVSSDHLGDISARHLGVLCYAKKLREILGNSGRLDKSTRSTRALALLALGVDLVHRASLLEDLLLENLVIALDLGEKGGHRLDALSKNGKVLSERTLNSGGVRGDGRYRLSFRNSVLLLNLRRCYLRGRGLSGLLGRLSGSLGRSLGGLLGSRFSRCSCHDCWLLYLYKCACV